LSKSFEVRFDFDEEKAAAIARKLHDDFWGQRGFFQGYLMPEYVTIVLLVLCPDLGS